MSYIVIFHTFSGVMQLEKELKKRNMVYMTQPAPRELSVDCGVSINLECSDIEGLIESVNTCNIHRIYHVDDGYELIYSND